MIILPPQLLMFHPLSLPFLCMYTYHQSIFRSSQRIGLIEEILENPEDVNGAALNIKQLLSTGVISKFYPLHDVVQKQQLAKEWASLAFPRPFLSFQPLDKIRKYFGEEISLYFAFLGFYTTWLWIASLFGAVAFVLWYVIRDIGRNRLVPILILMMILMLLYLFVSG